MSFHDVRLPKFIESCAIGQPEFSSSSAITISGREVRTLNREYARQKYLIKACRLSEDQFEQFNSFFRSRKGQRFSFRFRDYADYHVKRQFIAYGDSSCAKFQLFKLYHDDIVPYKRLITKLAKDTVKLYIEDQLVIANIDHNQGLISLAQNLSTGLTLSADFLFDVQVRFCADSFSYSYAADNSIELSDIELYEVIE